MSTSTGVVERFRGLVHGGLSREEAAAWAASIDRRATSFAGVRDPGLWWEALATLCGVNTAGDDLFGIVDGVEGPPFFIRDSDLAEWLANLEDRPISEPALGGLRRFRICEVPPGSLREDVAVVGGVFESGPIPDSLRGVDDLDYFDELDIILPSGRLAALRQYRGMPSDSTNVHLQFDEGDAQGALSELLRTLCLSSDHVRWRSERYF